MRTEDGTVYYSALRARVLLRRFTVADHFAAERPKSRTTKDRKYHEGLHLYAFPSCDVVPFVVPDIQIVPCNPEVAAFGSRQGEPLSVTIETELSLVGGGNTGSPDEGSCV